MSWKTICELDLIPYNAGVAALVEGKQVAIFKVKGELFAIDNFDPLSKANVLSRGIVCSIDDKLCVASPVYKQHFNLATGECLEENLQLSTFEVRENNGFVEINIASVNQQAA